MTKLAQFIEKETTLLEAATPGPWVLSTSSDKRRGGVYEETRTICDYEPGDIFGKTRLETEKNFTFIANVRTSHAQALAYLAAFEEVYKKHGCTHPEDCGLCFAKRAMDKSNQK